MRTNHLKARGFLALCVWSLAVNVGRAENHPTYETFLSYLTDFSHLPVIEPGVTCRQFSSYDRASKYDEATGKYINWDANGDSGKYLRTEKTGEGVMAEMDGPGCICRIWSANPEGIIRFYLDGADKPTYEWDFNELFKGAIDPFIRPLVWKRDPNNPQSASDCYLPIPYAKHCKVTSVKLDKNGKGHPPGHYYAIDYRTFPADWKVDTFKLPLTTDQHKTLELTARLWAESGSYGSLIPTRKPHSIKAGETLTIAKLKGPGVIEKLGLKFKSGELWASRKLLLRAYWDGESKPSIDCPIGDFFGEPREAGYKSAPMGIAEPLNYCYFPMPFHHSARIEVVNQGHKPAQVLYEYAWHQRPAPENLGLFHARWRSEPSSTTFDYPLIEATGIGKLVGICLFPDNIHGGWWGEGDEKVFVDGEKFPSWFGTGSEDYFGDAWGIRYFVNPSHGHPMKNVERMQGCYRWHLADNIPFYKSFRMTIENYTGLPDVENRNDYTSVAYWYQLPGGSDFFEETPVGRRIPRSYVAPGAMEAEKCVTQTDLNGANMDIVNDESLPQPLSSGKGVHLIGKAGDQFTFHLPARLEDTYTLEVVPAREVKASAFEILDEGRPAGSRVRLKNEPNPIAIRLTGEPVQGDRCELIVDYFKLAPYRKMITDWMVIGPFPNPEGKGLDSVYPPETELNFTTKYKGRDEKDVAWQKVSRPDGMIVLDNLVDPKENCVFYGACVVNCKASGKYRLLLGSDDGVKVWINGQLVHTKKAQRALKLDDDQLSVGLNQGKNAVLVKIEQGGGNLGFAVRFIDRKDDLSYELP